MKQFINAKFVSAEGLACSINGNPRWIVKFDTCGGVRVEAKTITDGACGYAVDNWRLAKERLADVKFHLTRNGNFVIDYIKNVR